MSDPLPEIRNEQDWYRVRGMQDDAIKNAKAECEKKGLTGDERASYITNAALPYFKRMTDPMNQVAIATAIREAQKHAPGTIREITASQQPAFFAELKRDTAVLNTEFGMHYPLPRVLVVKDYTKKNSGAQLGYDFNHDAITIDASYYATYLNDPAAARAALGHEMTHRYQRDGMIPLRLRANFADLPPEDLATVRNLESDADRHGAALVSPQAMARSLTQVLHYAADDPKNLGLALYQLRHDLKPQEAAVRYATLSDGAKNALASEVDRMPKPERAALSRIFVTTEIAIESANEPYIDHPSYATRMQALLGPLAPPAGMPYSDNGAVTAAPATPHKPASATPKR